MRPSGSISVTILAGLVGLASLFVAPLSAEPPVQRSSRRTIPQLLEMRTSVDMSRTPLDDAAAFLSELYRVNILVDEEGLAQVNVQRNVRIVYSAQMLLFKEILAGILEPYGLTFAVDYNIIVITNVDEAKRINAAAAKPMAFPKILDKIVTFDSANLPLRDALQSLGEIGEFNVMIDPAAAVHATSPVSLKLSDVRAATALKYLLRPLDLTYTIQDGAVVVVKPMEDKRAK